MNVRRPRLVLSVVLAAVAVLASGCILDGTYPVGRGPGRVAPGTYWSPGESGCYYERLSNMSGAAGAIIANKFVTKKGTQILTIAPGDAAFHTYDCGPWLPLGAAPLTASPKSVKLGEWTYRVGVDILPGHWRATPSAGAGCYWARLKGFGHTLDDIIANSFGGGTQIAQLLPSDTGFTSSGCGNWTYLGP